MTKKWDVISVHNCSLSIGKLITLKNEEFSPVEIKGFGIAILLLKIAKISSSGNKGVKNKRSPNLFHKYSQ